MQLYSKSILLLIAITWMYNNITGFIPTFDEIEKTEDNFMMETTIGELLENNGAGLFQVFFNFNNMFKKILSPISGSITTPDEIEYNLVMATTMGELLKNNREAKVQVYRHPDNKFIRIERLVANFECLYKLADNNTVEEEGFYRRQVEHMDGSRINEIGYRTKVKAEYFTCLNGHTEPFYYTEQIEGKDQHWVFDRNSLTWDISSVKPEPEPEETDIVGSNKGAEREAK